MASPEHRDKWVARAGLIQRVLASLALLVALLAVGSAFLPFGAFGQIRCRAPIFGGGVLHGAPPSSFLYLAEGPVCSGDAHSRLLVAFVVAALGLALGLAGWLLPTDLPWWMTGQERPSQEEAPAWLVGSDRRAMAFLGHLPFIGRWMKSDERTSLDHGHAVAEADDPDEPVVDASAGPQGEGGSPVGGRTDAPPAPRPAWGSSEGRQAPMPTPAGADTHRSRHLRR